MCLFVCCVCYPKCILKAGELYADSTEAKDINIYMYRVSGEEEIFIYCIASEEKSNRKKLIGCLTSEKIPDLKY